MPLRAHLRGVVLPDGVERDLFITEAGRIMDAMAAKGIPLVPTMSAVASPAMAWEDDPRPPEAKARARAAVERQPRRVREAHEAGVTVLAGTDVALAHGAIREEVARLARAGLPQEAAIGAASWNARSFLGFPSIEEGAPADLVAFPRDPIADLSVLAEPTLIVLAGRLIGTR
jgi:imidazolonepropionase-like amidohydrolase